MHYVISVRSTSKTVAAVPIYGIDCVLSKWLHSPAVADESASVSGA